MEILLFLFSFAQAKTQIVNVKGRTFPDFFKKNSEMIEHEFIIRKRNHFCGVILVYISVEKHHNKTSKITFIVDQAKHLKQSEGKKHNLSKVLVKFLPYFKENFQML